VRQEEKVTNPPIQSQSGQKGNDDAYLMPPPQNWMQTQMDNAMKMLAIHHTPPSNWDWCDHLPQTYYFKKIRTIFTGIPKSGCSNWLEALLRAEGTLQHKLEQTEVYKVHRGISAQHRMSHIAGTRRNVNEDFSFTVLRNPWTRMVSGYRDKLSDEPTQGKKKIEIGIEIVQEMRGIAYPYELSDLYPTFEEFLRYLIRHKGTDNPHFMPQHNILCIPQGRYDYLVPLEYSSVMKQDIWSHINTTVSLLGSYDSATDPRQQTSAQRAREWLMKIDKEIIDQLYEIYKEDFALLNYSNFTDPNFPLPIYQKN
jgi:hypothetical protein